LDYIVKHINISKPYETFNCRKPAGFRMPVHTEKASDSPSKSIVNRMTTITIF